MLHNTKDLEAKAYNKQINKVMYIADVMTDPLEKVKELAITFS